MPVLIPAAGASRRMRGRDKLLESVAGTPLLLCQIRAAQSVGPVSVCIPDLAHPRARLAARCGAIALVAVPDHKEGLAASLRRGVAALPPAERFMILLPDLPGLRAEDLRQIARAAANLPADIVLRASDEHGKPGHPIVVPECLRGAFADLQGDEGARALLAQHSPAPQLWPLEGDRATRDLDTPEDWAKWRAETGA